MGCPSRRLASSIEGRCRGMTRSITRSVDYVRRAMIRTPVLRAFAIRKTHITQWHMNAGNHFRFLEAGADDAPALSAPGGTPLTYRGAPRARRGHGRLARVAGHRPQRPRRRSCSTTGRRWRPRSWHRPAATAAPLNPTYRADEFEFYLTDLRAKLLVVGAGKDTPADRRRAEARRADRAARRASGARRGKFTLAIPRRTGGDTAAGPRRRRRRHRARAAHVGHDVAPEDRAARAQEHLRVGAQHPQARSRSRRTTAASSSCRSSTSTA